MLSEDKSAEIAKPAESKWAKKADASKVANLMSSFMS